MKNEKLKIIGPPASRTSIRLGISDLSGNRSRHEMKLQIDF